MKEYQNWRKTVMKHQSCNSIFFIELQNSRTVSMYYKTSLQAYFDEYIDESFRVYTKTFVYNISSWKSLVIFSSEWRFKPPQLEHEKLSRVAGSSKKKFFCAKNSLRTPSHFAAFDSATNIWQRVVHPVVPKADPNKPRNRMAPEADGTYRCLRDMVLRQKHS